MQNVDDTLIELCVQNAVLKLACEKALNLLQDGDAEASDADYVEKILKTALEKSD